MSINRIKGDSGVIIESTKYLKLPSAATSERPTNVKLGMVRYNTESHKLEFTMRPESSLAGEEAIEWRSIAFVDNDGKISTSLLPSSIISNLKYKGTWDAAINDINIATNETSTSEPLPAPTNAGEYYIVRVSGNGNGAANINSDDAPFEIGSWVVANGTSWEKINAGQTQVLANAVLFDETMVQSRDKHGVTTSMRVQQVLEGILENALDRRHTDTVLGDITFDNTASPRLLLANGTISSPSLSFGTNTASGLYLKSTNVINLVSNNTDVLGVKETQLEAYKKFLFTPNLVSSPAISFIGAPSCGIDYLISSLQLITGGIYRVQITDSKTQVTNQLHVSDGTIGSPGFTFTAEPTSGITRLAANDIGVSVAGNTKVRFLTQSLISNVQMLGYNGTITDPSYSFQNNSNTGMSSAVAGTIDFSNSSTKTLSISPTLITSQIPVSLKTNQLQWTDETNTNYISSNGLNFTVNTTASTNMLTIKSNSINSLILHQDALKIPEKQASTTTTFSTGMIRYNADNVSFEGYMNSTWYDLSSGGRIKSSGTLASPGLYFDEDASKDTGLYRPAEDKIGVVCSAIESMRFEKTAVSSYLPFKVTVASTTATITPDATKILFDSTVPFNFNAKVQAQNDIGLYDNGATPRQTYFRYSDGAIVEHNVVLSDVYLKNKGTIASAPTTTDLLTSSSLGVYQLDGDGTGISNGVLTVLNTAGRTSQFFAKNTIDAKNQLYFRSGTSTANNTWSAVVLDGGLYGTASFSNWIESTGPTGWRNTTYNGGIYMNDSTFVRVYNTKKFYVAETSADSITSLGGITIAGTVTNSSDPKLKTNINQLSDFKSKFKDINLYEYDRTDINNPDGTPLHQLGTLSSEVKLRFPDLVKVDSRGYETVDYATLGVLAIGYIKEVDCENEMLADKVYNLQQQINQLQEQIHSIMQIIDTK